jgi:hypothetical protein
VYQTLFDWFTRIFQGKEEQPMAIDVTALEEAIAAEDAGTDSVIAFINAMRDAINADLAGDAAAQQKVTDAAARMVANAEKLAAAIAAPAV